MIESGEYLKINYLMVSPDILKIESKKHQAKILIEKLKEIDSVKFTISGEIKKILNDKKIGNNDRTRINYWFDNIIGIKNA